MSTLSIRIAESLHRSVKDLARQDGVSVNQFINTALAEKISAMKTAEYFQRRLSNIDQGTASEDWRRVLAQVPDAPPDPLDRLPEA